MQSVAESIAKIAFQLRYGKFIESLIKLSMFLGGKTHKWCYWMVLNLGRFNFWRMGERDDGQTWVLKSHCNFKNRKQKYWQSIKIYFLLNYWISEDVDTRVAFELLRFIPFKYPNFGLLLICR